MNHKSFLLKCAVLTVCSFANLYGDTPLCYQDPYQQVIDKEGSLEADAELLVVTSTLTPIFSDEILSIPSSPAPNTIVLNIRDVSRVHPEYNLGYGLSFRYKLNTNIDLGVYYKYLRNNGSGSFQDDDIVPVNPAVGTQARIIQDDKGSVHSHMHLADFMFGGSYFLSTQTLIRVAGGVSYYNMHYDANFQDNDTTIQNDAIVVTVINQVRAQQNNKLWGFGPKLGVDLKYCFLPTCWNHDFNMYLNTEFAVYYTKEWSHGTNRFIQTILQPLTPDTIADTDTQWKGKPSYETTPSLNLDMGMKYAYHTSGGYDLSISAGYRLITFWYAEEIFRVRGFAGGEDLIGLVSGTQVDQHLVYSGPYARFTFGF